MPYNNNNNPFKTTRSARYTAAAPSYVQYRPANVSGRTYTQVMPLSGGPALGLSANYSPLRAESAGRGLILPRSSLSANPHRGYASGSNNNNNSWDAAGSHVRDRFLPPRIRGPTLSPRVEDLHNEDDEDLADQTPERADLGAPPREGREQRAHSPMLEVILEHLRAVNWKDHFRHALPFFLTHAFLIILVMGIAVKGGFLARYPTQSCACSCATDSASVNAPTMLNAVLENNGRLDVIDREIKDINGRVDAIDKKSKDCVTVADLRVYHTDRTGREDLANGLAGAQVIAHLTTWGSHRSQSLGSKIAGMFRSRIASSHSKDLVHHSFKGSYERGPHSPHSALEPIQAAGHCWQFPAEEEGHLGVRLIRRARLDAFSIEHIPRELVPDRNSAPLNVELWGIVDKRDKEAMGRLAHWRSSNAERDAGGADESQPDPPKENWVLLGTMRYYASSDAESRGVMMNDIQTVDINSRVKWLEIDFKDVQFRFKGNHGAANTCVYRVRVHLELDHLPSSCSPRSPSAVPSQQSPYKTPLPANSASSTAFAPNIRGDDFAAMGLTHKLLECDPRKEPKKVAAAALKGVKQIAN
ncbi:unnamed protein product [Tilletia laevis]|uniref:SUN domain-containing protein n=2 Tax=Tilletia TaxID=13289 RepID=A0A9N8LSX2_9BASI|nr:unnamed protein product [Tilletia laevis]